MTKSASSDSYAFRLTDSGAATSGVGSPFKSTDGVGEPVVGHVGEMSGGEPRNLVIVVRADPIICGHSTEARNLAEAAIASGFEQVHIVSYPLDVLETSGLPLKPIESVLPYSPGITVHRPAMVGDYKMLDGRLMTAMSGTLVDVIGECRGLTMVMCLYLAPHGQIVMDAVQSLEVMEAAGALEGAERRIVTIAEAVGSDITNVVSNALRSGDMGAARVLLSQFLMHDRPVAVSEYTRELIIASGRQVDEAAGTRFAELLEERVGVSYPAIDTSAYVELSREPEKVDAVLAKRGLERNKYLLFLSRVTPAKGVNDLIQAYRGSTLYGEVPLVVCGTGGAQPGCVELAAGDPNIRFFTDIGDDEKGPIMHGCYAYALPSKPRPEFIETFGIAVAEKMLAGGDGPVVTTATGGIPEATGGHCLEHVPGDVGDLRAKLNELHAMPASARRQLAQKAQAYALRFDRAAVLAHLVANAVVPSEEVATG
ncbi:MAG: glycosyltransferase family 4 protein [Planctomycetota bacterium]